MMENLLFFTHSGCLLLFGVVLSTAFSGISFSKKNLLILSGTSLFCGMLQLVLFIFCGTESVRKFYPLITHFPLLLLLCTVYQKKLRVAITAVATAYLCCNPAKWFGILIFHLTRSKVAEYITYISLLIIAVIIVLKFFAPSFSEIIHQEHQGIYIFSIVPVVYYLFDYITQIYTDFWRSNNRLALEFLPFFLCIVFIFFSTLYYKEWERKAYAQRKEHLISMALEQQLKEFEAVQRSEHEIRLLRHDMRLLLNNISMCIENDDKENARKLISTYSDRVEATTIQKYCSNLIINYLISDFAARCKKNGIDFSCQIAVERLACDEVIFSSIISNALDNALNAQLALPAGMRKIILMLKNHENKILLSVKNPYKEAPIFADGLPVSKKKGHGYGSQSISFLTEKLGGNCQFTLEDQYFVLRVVVNS